MESTSDPVKTKKKKSRTYFSIGCFFLLAMALFWSVDASFFFIFLGAACFFLFLGFYTRPTSVNTRQDSRTRYERSTQDSSPGSSFADDIKNIFERKASQFSQQHTQPQGLNRKLPMIVGVVMASIFIIPVLVVIFGSDSTNVNAVSYYANAENHFYQQQYDSAYIGYRRALQLDPEYQEAMIGYGKVLSVKNNPDSALLMFSKVLEINPDNKEAAYNKGVILLDRKLYDEGIALMSPIMETYTDYGDGMLLMGDFYYSQKNYDAAMPWYEAAYQNGSRSNALCAIMAYVYDTKGNYEKAIPLYKEALSFDSTSMETYKRLGELIPGEDGNFYRTKAITMGR